MRVTIFQEPERGDKVGLKRLHETLREAVGSKHLNNLIHEAKNLARLWFSEERSNFVSDEDQQTAKQKRKEGETAYRKFCDDLYKAVWPAPPPEPVLPPEVIQRLWALAQQIEEAKSKYYRAMDREKQAWDDMAKIQTDTQDARDALLALQDKAEMIRKGEL